MAYVEARYAPTLMAAGDVTADHVVQAVTEGFSEGETLYGIKARSILCCIAGMPETMNKEVLDLCQKHDGVVGIDVAGDEAKCASYSSFKHIF